MSYEEHFKDWLAYSPQDYVASLAAAHYYYNLAWQARGGSFWAKVPWAKRREYKKFIRVATDHTRAALELSNGDNLASHVMMVKLAKNRNRNKIAKEGLAKFPQSMAIRTSVMRMLQPRWGGSYKRMKEYAKQNLESALNTDSQNLIIGLVYEHLSFEAYKAEDYQQALEAANDALSYGDHQTFYQRRAMVFNRLGLYKKAMVAIDQAIELQPTNDKFYKLKSRVAAKLSDSNAAVEAHNKLEKLEVAESKIANLRSHSTYEYSKLALKVFESDTRKALSYYDQALQVDSNDHYSVYWRAMALLRLGDTEGALSGLKRSIEIDPTHFESYREIDYILMHEKRWRTIIGYWDQFLELVPDHPEALLERSGTHYHNGDNRKAKDDLTRACDLGLEKACTYKQRF